MTMRAARLMDSDFAQAQPARALPHAAEGKAPASEGAQRRAADRLLSGANLLPKSVAERSRRKFDLGGTPIPAYVPRGPRTPAPAPKPAPVPAPLDFSALPTDRELANYLTELDYPAFPSSAIDPITHYQGSGYTPINNFLRNGVSEEGTEEADVAEIDALFAMAPRMPVSGKVYRGMRSAPFGDQDMTGQIIRDKAFMSTSLKAAVAEQFSGKLMNPEDAVLFEIHLPEGAQFLPVQYAIDNLLNEDNSKPTTVSLLFYEAEILLPHGTALRIISDDRPDGGPRRIKAEVVL